MPIEYERIKPPKRKYRPYKCRLCHATAEWKETYQSRDRRRFTASWCLCDRCVEATGGVRT